MPSAGAVGAVVHSGWVILVTVTARDNVPVVVDRRRAPLIGDGLPSMPVHHIPDGLDRDGLAALIDRVRTAAERYAEDAFASLVESVRGHCRLTALAHRAPRPLPPTLDGILDSYTATLIADAERYLAAVSRAAGLSGIPVVTFARGREVEAAADALGVEPDAVDAFLKGLRASLGPPWQADHRTAAAAAIGAVPRGQAWRLP